MPTIGTDCHLTLQHDEINSGAAYGFLLDPASRVPEGIIIKREIYSEDDQPMKVWIYFDVLLAENLINLDGSQHSAGRAAMYAMLVSFLGKQDGISLTFGLGAITALGALEYTATEKHYGNHSVIRVQLTNVGEYFGVISEGELTNSVWDGTLNWETSYWR